MESVPCEPNPDCKYANKGQCPKTDTHHLYYPKKLYTDSVGKIFRELPENKVVLCRVKHEEIHATENIPIKPGREQMLQAIAAYVVGSEHGEATVHRS